MNVINIPEPIMSENDILLSLPSFSEMDQHSYSSSQTILYLLKV